LGLGFLWGFGGQTVGGALGTSLVGSSLKPSSFSSIHHLLVNMKLIDGNGKEQLVETPIAHLGFFCLFFFHGFVLFFFEQINLF